MSTDAVHFWMLLYTFLPAFVANMAPVLGRRMLPSLAAPIDGGATLGGKPLFGSHKTWRGLVFGIAAGIAVAGIQAWLTPEWLVVDVAGALRWVAVGALLGGGAIIGDLVKSFFKRRVGIASGKPWIPFDQLDLLIGSVVFILPLYAVSFQEFLSLAIAVYIGHLVINGFGYILGMSRAML